MGEYKSFLKVAGGGEGQRCLYPTRLDTYGCGCAHDCAYCYAKSLLEFRGLWNPDNPAVADIDKIRRKVKKLERGSIVRLGGMTDCFQRAEREHKVTLRTIEALNEQGVGYLIVTKSGMVADSEYMAAMDKDLAHVQISVTSTSDGQNFLKERADAPSRRIRAAERLSEAGFDVSLRVSPYVPELIDAAALNGVEVEKCLFEFMRVNHWIQKWTGREWSNHTVKEGGYRHLPLDVKRELLERFRFPQMTVCEDVQSHFEWFKSNFNANPDDCCNLRT